jgi:RNA polymerase sigma-70 factor (ECF subfamily)
MPNVEELTSANDEELIGAIAASEESSGEALQELYKRHASRLLAYLHTHCRSGPDAEDVGQEVWMQVFRSARQFKEGRFQNWLFTIARNRLIDLARRRRVRAEVPVVEGDGARFDEPIEEDERLAAMRDCLKQIDGEFVAAVIKIKLEGVSVEEVAREQNVSAGAVYTRVHRGTNQLRECIQKKLEGNE